MRYTDEIPEARRWLNSAERCDAELTAGIALIGIGHALLAIAEALKVAHDHD